MGTTCYVNDLDNLAGWTIDPAFTVTIDTLIKKHGAGSMKIVKPQVAGGNKQCTINITKCDSYLAYWIYLEMTQLDAGFSIYTRTATGGLAGSSFTYGIPPSVGIAPFIYTPDEGMHYGTTIYLANNTWHWLEIYYLPLQNIVSWRDFGLPIGSVTGLNVRDYIQLLIEGTMWMPAWQTHLDYIRIYSEYEYPPYYPPTAKLHPFWKLKP